MKQIMGSKESFEEEGGITEELAVAGEEDLLVVVVDAHAKGLPDLKLKY